MKIAHGTARLGSAFFFPLLLSLLIGTFPGLGFAHTSDWINTGQANARIVASSGSVMPGDSLWIAVEIDLPEGWHTYWRNPGDSGAPPTLDYSLPSGVTLGPIRWSKPELIPFGPLINIGYKNSAVFAQRMTVSDQFGEETLPITLKGRWLVCADVCIPESGELALTLSVGMSPESGQSLASNEAYFESLASTWPSPLGVGDLTIWDQEMIVRVPREFAALDQQATVTFLPFEPDLIDLRAAQTWVTSGASEMAELRLPLLEKPTMDVAGLLLFEEQVGGQRLSGAVEIRSNQPASEGATGQLSLFSAILFAALGGLILNLMPCVFPVLSIKVLNLVEPTSALSRSRSGWFYGLGVFVSFLALAAILIGLRALGESLGWGFQLQLPWLVGLLALLFVMIGLNLSGYFEIGLGLQTMAGDVGKGRLDAEGFGTGVLAVVVAAPCTAPFMGAALGYAVTQPIGVTLLIFGALGAGMAAPVVALTQMPSLLSYLPRPGPWMEKLKEFLAFPMYGSALWLVWVLVSQSGSEGLLIWGIALLLILLLIWMGKQWRGARGLLWVVAVVVLALLLPQLSPLPSTASSTRIEAVDHAEEIAYSEEAIAKALANGSIVFVDFTADWCITCKVNERIAIDVVSTQTLFEREGVVFMVADWTLEDEAITKALARFGRVGVPLYLVYRPDLSEPIVLPQLLTPEIIRDAVTG
ncbi:MAG: protein-disulfide reductase DsbD domain-containing protein [Gammaproteobacteria bacterium]